MLSSNFKCNIIFSCKSKEECDNIVDKSKVRIILLAIDAWWVESAKFEAVIVLKLAPYGETEDMAVIVAGRIPLFKAYVILGEPELLVWKCQMLN